VIGTILFAGTFDPFHRGHRAILESALDAHPQASALVSPARRPHWRARPSLPYERRLAIARASIAGLRAEVFEEPEGEHSALSLVRAVAARPGSGELLYLVGADAAASLPDWEGRAALLAIASIAVAPRPGIECSIDTLIAREPALMGRISLLPARGEDVSASAVRSGARELLVPGAEGLLEG
jgi:nicotinate-nucleotide adenylyltransferase